MRRSDTGRPRPHAVTSIDRLRQLRRPRTQRRRTGSTPDERPERDLKYGVTGVLFYNGGNFMQCLEGPEASIAHIYGRIRQSRRHHNILELMDERVSQRHFDGWEMALVEPTRSELLALSTARWKTQAGAKAPAMGSDGWRLMNALWQSARG